MSFFKKLKDRLFKSSSKIDEGLEAIVQEATQDIRCVLFFTQSNRSRIGALSRPYVVAT